MSKILGHIGELLDEYRELGAALESKVGQTAVERKEGDKTAGGESKGLTARQELLLQRFETTRQNFLRSYRNVDKQQPYETASYYVRQVIEKIFFLFMIS